MVFSSLCSLSDLWKPLLKQLSNSATCSRKPLIFQCFWTSSFFLSKKKKIKLVSIDANILSHFLSEREFENTCCFTSIFAPSFSLCETLVCFPPRVWWRPMRSTPWRWGLRSSSPPTRTGTTAAPGRRGRVKAADRTPPSPNTPSTRHLASRRACR